VNKTKILFLSDNFPPEGNAPANRTCDHCKEWVNLGYDVTVITCAPNFPKGKVFEGYKNKLYQEEEITGIKVIRVWSFITANEGTIKRILDYCSFAFMAFIVGLFQKSDVIIATSPQFFTAVAGRWLSFWKRIPWVFEVRDLWPESIVAVGAMKRGVAIRFFEWLEKRLYQSADRIVVVTDSFKQQIKNKGINPDKIFVFKNGANLEQYKPIEKDLELLQILGLENKKVFAYIGTHGMAHGLEFILNSVNELKNSNPELHFLFIGDGAEKNHLIKIKGKLGISNVTMLDSVPKTEVIRYLSIMDVALVNLKKSDTFLNVIPSKIFEAAAMGKPILLGLEGETKQIIEFYQGGLCYEPENKTSFLKSVLQIIEPENYTGYSDGALRLAADFDRKKIALAMVEMVDGVVTE